MNDYDALTLYRLARRLDAYEIDNGPMGSPRPFAKDAELLRRIADNNADSTDTTEHIRHLTDDDCRPY